MSPINNDRTRVSGSDFESPERSKLLSYREVATWLSVSESYLRRLVMRRMIPFLKIGRSVRFRAPDIEQWIEKRYRQ